MSDFVNQLDEGIDNVVETLQGAQQSLRNGQNINAELSNARRQLETLEGEARSGVNRP